MIYFTNKANALTLDYIKTVYTLVPVLPGTCRYNYMCHANAVHDAWVKKEPRIALVVYIDSGTPLIHFVNENKAGKLVDNTLGYWARGHDYYFIKWMGPEEWPDVFKIHKEFKKILISRLPFYIRMLGNPDY